MPHPKQFPSGLKATAPTFPVVGHGQEVLPSHLKGLPVPSTVGGNPLVGCEPQLSLAPFVNDGELLTLFIRVKVSHSQEDLKDRTRGTWFSCSAPGSGAKGF